MPYSVIRSLDADWRRMKKAHILETNPEKPVVPQLSPDTEYRYGNTFHHNYPWVVGFCGREIIYTGHHGITDGMGATIFMRTVLYYYLREMGAACDPGKAVTLEQVTPEFLEKDTECRVRKNGGENIPSRYQPGGLQPTVFPEEMLADHPEDCVHHNLAISLEDIRKKCAEYGVSQFAVVATYVAQAVCSVLPGSDNAVMMNIITDMRGVLDSCTTHNCVMAVPIFFTQKDLTRSDEFQCSMFRSRLDLGFNRDEVLHNCFRYAQMEQQIGNNKESLAAAGAAIVKKYGLTAPVAAVTYTHLTRTGFSDDILRELDDVYINLSGFKVPGRQAIMAMNAVTTNRVINLLIVDGTKDDLIFRELKKRLTDAQVSFVATELDRYKGVIYSA